MTQNNNIYVIGHKHPDSDSICSAITYADLLNRLGRPAIPCRQGPLNEETKFILERFHQEHPLLMTDARAMIRDIDIDPPTFIQYNDTAHHAWHVMLAAKTRSLFVVDEECTLMGVVTNTDLSVCRLAPDASIDSLMARATMANIARTIGGQIVVNQVHFKSNGKVKIITLEDIENENIDLNNAIAILSSSEENQKLLMKLGVRLIIITCGKKASEEVQKMAREHGVGIIETEHDTMHTARVVTESYSVDNIMTTNVVSFKDTDLVDDVHMKMLNDRVRAYPVIDAFGKVIGSISRYHTRKYNRRKFALVDHSSTLQAINNLSRAEVVAIVDHHNIGDVTTSMPIEYRNHICGCTCTIITRMYRENGFEPSPDMCGLLLSAIISDTLNFKSTTTTKVDIETGKWLAEKAGITDIDAYARDMLGASVALEDSTPEEIISRDLKTYSIGKHRVSIGQTNFSHMEVVQKILPEIKEQVTKMQKTSGVSLLVMMFTDVMGEGSVFVYSGPQSNIMHEIIGTVFDEQSGFDPKIISRKQQMLPKVSALIADL